MSKGEWDKKKHQVIQRADDIHTEKDLQEFMTKHMQIRMPKDNVSWSFYLMPNFKEG